MDKTHNLVLLPAAQRELEELIALHLALSGEQSARRIADQIYQSLERLEYMPDMGIPFSDSDLRRSGYRMLVIGKHLCFYRALERTIYLYHIVDGRTDYPWLFRTLPKDSER